MNIQCVMDWRSKNLWITRFPFAEGEVVVRGDYVPDSIAPEKF